MECDSECPPGSQLITKRFVIAQTLIWQYFFVLVAMLYVGLFDVMKEVLVVYGGAVGIIVYYYFRSDVERHSSE